MQSIPGDYETLAEAIRAGELPDERYWIDYKLDLYDRAPDAVEPSTRQRKKAHDELARDVASMATRGGYLIYGVEQLDGPVFEPVGMQLNDGLRELIDNVARQKVTPPLEVLVRTYFADSTKSQGLLVVEVPESEFVLHQVDGTYYGRSDTGKVKLRDADVERLMLSRSRAGARLAIEIDRTAEYDPIELSDRDRPRIYLTAVPLTGWREMFACYSRDRSTALQLLNSREFNPSQPELDLLRKHWQGTPPLQDYLTYLERSQRRRGMWFRNWGLESQEIERFARGLGVDDDGILRFLALGLGEELKLAENLAMACTISFVNLVQRLSQAVGYRGTWDVGIQLAGIESYLPRPRGGFPSYRQSRGFDTNSYVELIRVDGRRLAESRERVISDLLRPLYRGMGLEGLLPIVETGGGSRHPVDLA